MELLSVNVGLPCEVTWKEKIVTKSGKPSALPGKLSKVLTERGNSRKILLFESKSAPSSLPSESKALRCSMLSNKCLLEPLSALFFNLSNYDLVYTSALNLQTGKRY